MDSASATSSDPRQPVEPRRLRPDRHRSHGRWEEANGSASGHEERPFGRPDAVPLCFLDMSMAGASPVSGPRSAAAGPDNQAPVSAPLAETAAAGKIGPVSEFDGPAGKIPGGRMAPGKGGTAPFQPHAQDVAFCCRNMRPIAPPGSFRPWAEGNSEARLQADFGIVGPAMTPPVLCD